MKSLIAFAICLSCIACSTTEIKPAPPTGDSPKLLAPSVKKIWIAPIIKDGGREREEGHYLYRIEREVQWGR